MGNLVSLPVVGCGGHAFANTLFNLLLPMHVQLDQNGKIVHAGPTFAKLLAYEPVVTGKYLFDFIQFSYPKNIVSTKSLAAHFGIPLTAQIKAQSGFDLKAVAVAMPGNAGILINFAFGTSLKEAVSHWHLNSKDFSAADPTVEMLYVIEVQSVLLEASRSLNDRLNGQREDAEEKAYTDPLTGLFNRRALNRYIKRLHRRRVPVGFAVFLIDLDHFKLVNDTLGHAAGDQVLQKVAGILLNETRPTDIVVRTGGDEFVLVLEKTKDINPLEVIAKRIIRKIDHPVLWDGQNCYVGASIGIVRAHTKDNRSIDFHLQSADEALYSSKNNGRGTFRFVG